MGDGAIPSSLDWEIPLTSARNFNLDATKSTCLPLRVYSGKFQAVTVKAIRKTGLRAHFPACRRPTLPNRAQLRRMLWQSGGRSYVERTAAGSLRTAQTAHQLRGLGPNATPVPCRIALSCDFTRLTRLPRIEVVHRQPSGSFRSEYERLWALGSGLCKTAVM
ncbi:hypothetical protein DHEL01_v208179 [Diaporthe helianthi]|uniref:Uncharacterized protein n=1 Tax=Diaporthe helianthi TaxID=158607 RepID=A0A2P5HT96_DIAHE|nr:hypothetical protein DHEL01_v208179 [Diaporthe helianthi]